MCGARAVCLGFVVHGPRRGGLRRALCCEGGAVAEEETSGVTVGQDFRGRERKRPVREHEWTPKKRETFLAQVAIDGCARSAAAAAGMPERSAYALRAREPEFDTAWTEAMRMHFDGLEAMLLRKARGEAVPELGEVNVELALALLRQHRAALVNGPRKGGPRPRTASKAELIAALRKQLDAVKRRQGKKRDERG